MTTSGFTTMIDLYALPRDFPGFDECKRIRDALKRVRCLQEAFAEDIGDRRFIPYLQLHEYEALLLSEPSQFRRYFVEAQGGVESLEKLVSQFESPELINEGPETAPSKRVEAALPGYESQKVAATRAIVTHIGLETMRHRCSHFGNWLAQLETLSLA